MSRYTARIRQLEAKLRPGECRACGDGQQVSVEMVEVLEGQPVPVLEPKLCEVCGKPQKRVVWLIHAPSDDRLPAITGVRGEVTAPLTPQSMTPEAARAILRAAEEDGTLPRSEQPAAALTHPSPSAAERVAAANCSAVGTNGTTDITTARESHSWLRLDDEQPRRRRRRSTARRDQSPPEVDEDIVRGVWGDEWIDEFGCRQGGRDGVGWKRLGEL